ncbi:MAG: hypothetical protein WBA93_11300 [Microcoleaceae cyanobacterium]
MAIYESHYTVSSHYAQMIFTSQTSFVVIVDYFDARFHPLPNPTNLLPV